MLHNASMTTGDPFARVQAAFAHRKRSAAPFLLEETARRLNDKLDLITLTPRVIAVVGSGHGESLPLLRTRYPQAQFIDIAASPVLQAARVEREAAAVPRWLSRLGLAKPSAGDARHVAPPDALPLADGSVDLLWANLAAAWWGSAAGLAREWLRVLRPGGFVMFSALGPDTAREWRAAAHTEVDTRQLIDLHDWGDALVHAGFSDPVMDMEHLRLTYADAAAAVAEWRALLPTRPRSAGLRGRARHAALRSLPASADGGRAVMTAELVYGHAFCVERRRGETTVGVDTLRAALPSHRTQGKVE